MFKQEADWRQATILICDVLRGSASLTVETHASLASVEKRENHFSAWSYNQTQPHRTGPSSEPQLFSPDHLERLLVRMAQGDPFFAYETPSFQRLGDKVEGALSKFSEISLSSVKLVVGDVILSWLLVSLTNPRDLILWKMQYHLRDVSLTDGKTANPG